ATAATTSAGVTATPCSLKARPNKTTSFSFIRVNLWFSFENSDVSFVFEETTDRLVQHFAIDLRCIQRDERSGPVERLRHTGHFGQIHRPRLLNDLRDLA